MDAIFNLFTVSEADHLIQRQVEVSIICEILYNGKLLFMEINLNVILN